MKRLVLACVLALLVLQLAGGGRAACCMDCHQMLTCDMASCDLCRTTAMAPPLPRLSPPVAPIFLPQWPCPELAQLPSDIWRPPDVARGHV